MDSKLVDLLRTKHVGNAGQPVTSSNRIEIDQLSSQQYHFIGTLLGLDNLSCKRKNWDTIESHLQDFLKPEV